MKNNTLSRLLGFLKKYGLLAVLSIASAVVIVCLTLYAPVLIGNAIDLIIGKGNVNFADLKIIVVKIAVVVSITALLQWVMNVINNHIIYHIVNDMRNEVFAHLQIMPVSFIDSHSHGDIVSRVISDIDQFADGLLLGFSQLFTGIITIILTLVFMFNINWIIALTVVVLSPLSLFIAKFITGRTHTLFKKQSVLRAEQTSFINEIIGNQKVSEAFSRGQGNIENFDDINGRLTDCSLKAIFFSSLTNPSVRFLNNLIYAVVVTMGAFSVMGMLSVVPVSMTVGSLSCFLSYATQYSKPFNEITGVINELQNSYVCASRVIDILNKNPQEPESDNAAVLSDVSGNIELKNVYFHYDGQEKLIENFNLSVNSGERIAIVGPTGCGKTTLINLLMRFYDINSGKITVDGYDIKNVTRNSLRSNYGMVLQDTWIKSGTVRENIALAKENATDEEIIAAAKAAHAHGFIKRLPNGYDTVITEGGNNLSAGQKQLLCISRVMLCLPPMLILDEATSSIDTRTELKIQNAFAKLMKGRTSFIVAHRLSTIKEADVILVMKNGNIIEQGTHESLIDKKGFYYNLYNSQFEI